MKKSLLMLGLATGLLSLPGCATPNNTDKPWDKPIQEDNRPGYKSQDEMPLNRDAK